MEPGTDTLNLLFGDQINLKNQREVNDLAGTFFTIHTMYILTGSMLFIVISALSCYVMKTKYDKNIGLSNRQRNVV